jgi:hypothetical protein
MLLRVMQMNVTGGKDITDHSTIDPILWILNQCINGKELAPSQKQLLEEWLESSPIHQSAFDEMMDPRYLDRYIRETHGYL